MGDEPAGRAGVDAGTALESVLRESARPMLQFADFVLNDLSAAEDATQDALVIAWRRRKKVKQGDHLGWVRRIVLRECLRWRRHPVFRLFALKDRVGGPAGQESATQSDVALEVGRLLLKAPAVAFMHYYQGFTVAKASSQLRMPAAPGTNELRPPVDTRPAAHRS